jgi:hypothetical protein
MDGTLVIILVVAVAAIGYIVLRRKGKLGAVKGLLVKSDPVKDIERLAREREREELRYLELEALLKAKQDLVKTRAENRKLEKQIEETTVERELGPTLFPKR